MKKTIILSFLACAAACLAFSTSCKQTGETAVEEATDSTIVKSDFAYFDLDRIMQEYDMANDLRTVVETKANNIQADLTRRANKLQNDVNALQDKINKGLITRSTAEIQAQKLDKQQQTFNNYAAQKQQEIQEEQIVMMNQIGDAIKTFVEKFNEEKQYQMIFANQASSPVVTALPGLDITDQILAGLNEEYVISKNQKKDE